MMKKTNSPIDAFLAMMLDQEAWADPGLFHFGKR